MNKIPTKAQQEELKRMLAKSFNVEPHEGYFFYHNGTRYLYKRSKNMIIGFSGKAGVGKDTAADYLVAQGFTKLSFATPLKNGMAAMGFPEPANRADKEAIIPGFNFSWREAAQNLGTGARHLDEDIWVKCVLKIMQASPDADFVVSDVRFENEAAMIRSAGGVIMHLHGTSDANLGSLASHVSEKPIEIVKGQDFVIVNERNPLVSTKDSLARLYDNIDEWLAVIEEVAYRTKKGEIGLITPRK